MKQMQKKYEKTVKKRKKVNGSDSRKRKEMEGYLTIEASFLVTIILCILILMIYLSFFLYDRALVAGSAYQAALEGARRYDLTDEEILEYTEERAHALVEKKLLACTYQISVKVTWNEVSVTYDVNINLPFGSLLEKQLCNGNVSYVTEKKASKLSGVSFIDSCKNLQRITNAKEE